MQKGDLASTRRPVHSCARHVFPTPRPVFRHRPSPEVLCSDSHPSCLEKLRMCTRETPGSSVRAVLIRQIFLVCVYAIRY